MMNGLLDEDRYTTVKIDREVVDELRDAIAAVQAAQHEQRHMTLMGTLTRGARLALDELRFHHNQGEPFAPRTRELSRGNYKRGRTRRPSTGT